MADATVIEDLAMEDAEDAVQEPEDYWEKEQVANAIANFTGDAQAAGSSMPMLVAVRVRPLWDKARATHSPPSIAAPPAAPTMLSA